MANVELMASRITQHLRSQIPQLLAVYLFGSRVTDDAAEDSDWDVALWSSGKIEPLYTWSLANELAEICGGHVDLVDLGSASTVMQYQVITTGERVWRLDTSIDVLEAMVLSEKTALDEARGPLLDAIIASGKVLN